jgi:cob(I)alamin adenosyltransferase
MKRIYTRTGDLGETSLLGGPRVAKDTTRVEAFGQIDELNAHLGLARAELGVPPSDAQDNALPPVQNPAVDSKLLDAILRRIQDQLFILGGELSARNPVETGVRMINEKAILALESDIDRCQEILPHQKTFLRPCGTRTAAQLHVARTVCRRAERNLIRLMREPYDEVSRRPLAYLNRLSDLLYVMARVANVLAGRDEESPDVP